MKRGGLGSRLLVAAWGIPLILSLTYLGGYWTLGLVAAIAFGSQLEYFRLLGIDQKSGTAQVGIIGGVAVVVSWLAGSDTVVWALAAFIVVAALAGIMEGKPHRQIALAYSSLIYPAMLAGTFLYVRAWTGHGGLEIDAGSGLALGIWGGLWIGDTAAYAGGRLFGKHPLALKYSPQKTVEGFLAGLIGAILFVLLWWKIGFAYFDTALVLGIATGVVGQIGDLFESALKREADVKDAGRLLPGHGGILDRFDSFLFAAPAVALYLALRG